MYTIILLTIVAAFAIAAVLYFVGQERKSGKERLKDEQ